MGAIVLLAMAIVSTATATALKGSLYSPMAMYQELGPWGLGASVTLVFYMCKIYFTILHPEQFYTCVKLSAVSNCLCTHLSINHHKWFIHFIINTEFYISFHRFQNPEGASLTMLRIWWYPLATVTHLPLVDGDAVNSAPQRYIKDWIFFWKIVEQISMLSAWPGYACIFNHIDQSVCLSSLASYCDP